MALSTLIYDDCYRVPGDVLGNTGSMRFGQLWFRRRRLADWMRLAAEKAGFDSVVHLRESTDIAPCARRLAAEEAHRVYVFLPAHLAYQGAIEELSLFLARLRYARHEIKVVRGPRGVLSFYVLTRSEAAAYLAARDAGQADDFAVDHIDRLETVSGPTEFVDLREPGEFAAFMASSFEARHFNAIEQDHYTVAKRSHDKAKLSREYEYVRGLPEPLQMYFVRPFDFRDEGETASYRMERLFVPDAAIQWVHGGFSIPEFKRFLERLFDFVARRPARSVDRTTAERVARDIYVDKLRARVKQLQAVDGYVRVRDLIGNNTNLSSVEALVERFATLYDAASARRTSRHLVMGHGDLCFSNILYSRATQILRLIDPRGALPDGDAYADEYYDLAKLSHSVMGDYDYINAGLFELSLDDRLQLQLQVAPTGQQAHKELFLSELAAAGFDPALVRLYEASLFLSMLPLHIDVPRKVVAFVMTAQQVLDAVENTLRRVV